MATEITSPIIKSDAKRGVLYAQLYPAMRRDTDREAMTDEQIDASVERLIENGRLTKVDVNHDFRESGCKILEIFKVRPGDPDFPEIPGDWMVGIKMTPAIQAKVDKGELGAVSWGTSKPCTRTPMVVDVSHPLSATGKTEKCGAGLLPEHEHAVSFKFDDNSKIIPTYTDETLGHVHGVVRTGATESNLDHSHPMLLELGVLKFNPNHDEAGRFSSSDGAVTNTGAHPADKSFGEHVANVVRSTTDKALDHVQSFRQTTGNSLAFMAEVESALIGASRVVPVVAPVAVFTGEVTLALGALHLAVVATDKALSSLQEELKKPDVSVESVAKSDAAKHAVRAAKHVKDLVDQLTQEEDKAQLDSGQTNNQVTP